jgi:chemotaxis signal transduction protein
VDAVLIPVGGDVYAVPIEWVREVVVAPALTQLVTGPATVLGLFNLRGEIVPLLDTAALLGLVHADPVAFSVVLHTHLGPVALSASAVPLRRQLTESLGPAEHTAGAELYRFDARVAVLLDVQAVLDSVTSSIPEAPTSVRPLTATAAARR